MKLVPVSIKSQQGVCSYSNYTAPVQPGAGLDDVLRVLFQQPTEFDKLHVDSGPSVSSAKLRERK